MIRIGDKTCLPQRVCNQSPLSTAKTLAGIALCAILSTSCKTKLCYLRSFYKISPEEELILQKQKEKIAYCFLDTFSVPKNASESVRENLASLIVATFHRIMECNNHWSRQLFTDKEMLESCCRLLVACNFSENSLFLKSLLDSLSIWNIEAGSVAYNKALKESQNLEEDDEEEDQMPDCKSFKMIHQATPDSLQPLSLEERELLAKEAVSLALFLLKHPTKDPSPVLLTFCGSNGVLRKCNLPGDSECLKELLAELDQITGGKASLLFQNCKS
ncbi:MAG TPA: hypothetical protein VLE96_04110 [Chlamydiales bacterium]|nr:hypothetical protein [Chlamydiales bacterium]